MNERIQYAVVVTVTVVVCVCLQRDPLAWRFALHQVVRGMKMKMKKKKTAMMTSGDEWRVVKALFHQSINQVAEEGGEKTKATTKASRQKEVPLCVASRMDGWIDGQTDDDDCG